jgi:hypothetical protein
MEDFMRILFPKAINPYALGRNADGTTLNAIIFNEGPSPIWVKIAKVEGDPEIPNLNHPLVREPLPNESFFYVLDVGEATLVATSYHIILNITGPTTLIVEL